MDKEYQIEYNKLYAAYKELEDSKLVLIEKSISNLLKVVAKSELLYNLIAESVLGFNYEKELNAAIKGEEFKLPQTEDKIVPLVFCILNDIDNGKISAISFITKTFMGSGEEEYLRFAKDIVLPFVEQIKKQLGAEDAPEITNSEPTNNGTGKQIENLFNSELISRMNYILNKVNEGISSIKKAKQEYINEASTIAYSAGLCLVEGEYLGVFGLFLGLKLALQKLKKFKNEIKEIDLLLKLLYEIN